MKIRYTVEAQDAIGNRLEINVRADTDERACAAVLAELNSWRAIRALPASANRVRVVPVETTPRSEAETRPAGVQAEVRSSFRIVGHTGPRNWVRDSLRGGGRTTAISRAFSEAAGPAGADGGSTPPGSTLDDAA